MYLTCIKHVEISRAGRSNLCKAICLAIDDNSGLGVVGVMSKKARNSDRAVARALTCSKSVLIAWMGKPACRLGLSFRHLHSLAPQRANFQRSTPTPSHHSNQYVLHRQPPSKSCMPGDSQPPAKRYLSLRQLPPLQVLKRHPLPWRYETQTWSRPVRP